MKKSIKQAFTAILALIMMVTLTACGGSATPPPSNAGPDSAADAAKSAYVFKVANVVADTHPYNMGAQNFKETLEAAAAAAGYNVTVEIYSNSALGGERELAESMQLGTLDMALIPGCITSFYEPLGVFDLPYLFESREQAYEILDGEIGAQVVADMPEVAGFRLLAYWENGYRNMTNSKRAIHSPEDVVGLTMRVPENNVYVSFFSALGANVVTMSFNELYTALQQKTVDGQENPTALIATNKLYETQTFMSMTEHFYGPAEFCISEKLWKTLPQDLQQLIQSAAISARDYERQCCQDKENEYLEEIKSHGTQVNEVDKALFQDAADTVYKQFETQYGDIVARIKGK